MTACTKRLLHLLGALAQSGSTSETSLGSGSRSLSGGDRAAALLHTVRQLSCVYIMFVDVQISYIYMLIIRRNSLAAGQPADLQHALSEALSISTLEICARSSESSQTLLLQWARTALGVLASKYE